MHVQHMSVAACNEKRFSRCFQITSARNCCETVFSCLFIFRSVIVGPTIHQHIEGDQRTVDFQGRTQGQMDRDRLDPFSMVARFCSVNEHRILLPKFQRRNSKLTKSFPITKNVNVLGVSFFQDEWKMNK